MAARSPPRSLPAGALAYARIDLDPAANQKLALFNIARKFTVTKDAFSGEDPREAFFKAISTDNESFKDIDYAADIEPWLGDRIGFAGHARHRRATSPASPWRSR